jgi:hypothetical protein
MIAYPSPEPDGYNLKKILADAHGPLLLALKSSVTAQKNIFGI